MDRRDLMKILAGVPAVAASTVALSSVVQLDPHDVSTNMRVFDDGAGAKFSMTLIRKPWPKVGDVIQFGFDNLSFRGTVTSWETESLHGRDRVYYHLRGSVQGFEALDLLEKK